jgi:hypothetical protein
MKTVDLSTEHHSLAEILEMAKSDDVLLHSASGDDFLVERADEFDREVATHGRSSKFMSFLAGRSSESGDLSFRAVREKRGL